MSTRNAPIALVTTAIKEMSNTSMLRLGRRMASRLGLAGVDAVDEVLQAVLRRAIQRRLLAALHDVLQKHQNAAQEQRNDGGVEGDGEAGGDLLEGDALGIGHAFERDRDADDGADEA